MKLKTIIAGVTAAALFSMTANACPISVRVACPNDQTAKGIRVYILDATRTQIVGEDFTDELGTVKIELPWMPETYNVCVDESTLPPGFTLNKPCQLVKVLSDAPPVVEFTLGGERCENPPPPGECWLTGGGTIGKTKGVPNYSFGGVVYPGCSPKAADGGNWNLVDHDTGLHFQGQKIIVDKCSGEATQSPKVNVNIIDFHGEGILRKVGDPNWANAVPVTFIGTAVDNYESGGDKDMLFLVVSDSSGMVMQIGTPADPVFISTGNLQIHTTSCK